MSYRVTLAAGLATVLASLALYPLVMGWLWFWEAAGGVAVVALIGALTKTRALPWLVCAGASLVGLLLYLNVLFASRHSLARVIPTTSSLHRLLSLAGAGFQETSRFAPPAPARPGILILVVAGVGIIATVTDLLAVRLRRPALAGLPLLVLFCVPLTDSVHQGVFGAMTVFALGMAGYLTLLAVDGREKLRVWGRLVTVFYGRPARGDDGPPESARQPAGGRSGLNTKELSAAGRRIGLAAVALALFVPLLVPGLHNHKLFPAHGVGAGGSIALPNPLAQMNSELHRSKASEVLRYHTTDPAPQYLQVYVLNKLTPTTWTLAPTPGAPLHSGKLSNPPGLGKDIPATAQHTQIKLAPGLTGSTDAADFLPLPYPAQDVAVGGDWRQDPGTLTLYSARSLSGLSYSVTSKDLNPSTRELENLAPASATILRQYTDVPTSFLSLMPLAQRIVGGQTTPYGKAVALQRWFTESGKFSYSLNAHEPASAAALIQFLRKVRRGYCQQFAFAMAVLARLLNIPARVAIGYTPGSYAGNGNWVVKTSDAHAWPELYIQGIGWLRFEPTPSGPGGQATAVQPSYTLPQAGLAPGSSHASANPTTPAVTPTAGGRAPGALAKLQHLSGNGSAADAARTQSAPLWALLTAVIAVLLIAPRAGRSLIRRRRWRRAADQRARAHAAWRELVSDLSDHRIECLPSESPRATAIRLRGRLTLETDQAEALERIAVAEERARYAKEPASGETLRADVSLMRGAAAANSGAFTRWRARLVPPSALAPPRTALRHVLDIFGWIDLAVLRVRDWARHSVREHREAGA